MGMIEEIATYLDAQSTRFAVPSNLFVNFLPDEPNTAAALYETGGGPPTRTFIGNGWENPRVQLVCRSSNSSSARANIDAAWTILEGVANTTISGSTYLRVAAVQSPFLLDRDAKGRVEFACNFEVARRR